MGSRKLSRRVCAAVGRLVLGVACLGGAAACAPSRGTIGAVLGQQDDGRLFVREVPQGLGADRAGLEPGDEILSIDGLDVRQLSARQIHDALSGDLDSEVKLTLLRDEQVVRVTVKRTEPRRHRPGAPEPAEPPAGAKPDASE